MSNQDPPAFGGGPTGTIVGPPFGSKPADTRPTGAAAPGSEDARRTQAAWGAGPSATLPGTFAGGGTEAWFANTRADGQEGERTVAFRQYADGVLVTARREPVMGQSAGVQAIQLPYASDQVVRRIGAYDVLGELGRGSMGTVYKAYSLQLCRFCAVKVMTAGTQVSVVQLVRFQNEAMLAARLSHPNIVPIFDAGEDEGEFYFVMAYVEGRPLSHWINDRSIAVETIVSMAAKCARALDYAHQHGVVHRDVKPDNILIDAKGEPHITDFGIAANVRTDRRMTHDGAVMGTPAYMAPEQVNGEVGHIGPPTDVYALGSSLFHLLTGREVFTGRNVMHLLQKVLVEEPPRPSVVGRLYSRRPISIDLETVCLKALEKRVSRRYASAAAFAEDLEAVVDGRPVSARPISGIERLGKLIRRNRGAFAIASLVVATLFIVGLSFGAITLLAIEQTSETIRNQDEQAGLEQAATLERAIRVNMLQGRADVVRELVHKLREDPVAKSVDVVRNDRSFAYSDLSTRKRVERRLDDPRVLEAIRRDKPEFIEKVEEVRRLAFTNIDRQREPGGAIFDYDRAGWTAIVETAVPKTERSSVDGEPVLTVFKPIENSPACQVCHGAPGEEGYGENDVRAVLVVRRSQEQVESRVRTNRRTALVVGVGTAVALLGLVWLTAVIFGIRLRRNPYGV